MSSPERLYHGSIRVLSVVFILLGVALLGITLGSGGGPLSIGVLMGAGFVAVGCGRLWAGSRVGR